MTLYSPGAPCVVGAAELREPGVTVRPVRFDGGMENQHEPRLLKLEQVRQQVGLATEQSARNWCNRNEVPVVSKRVSARLFYAVWEPEPFDAEAALARLRR